MKTLSLGPIYLCDKAPVDARWVSIEKGEPCPFCGRPLVEHKTSREGSA